MMVPTSANSSPAVWHDWHGAISSWLWPWPTFSRNSPLIQIWKPRNKRTSDAKMAATRSFQSENFACWFQGKRPESLCIFQGEQRQSSWWCHGRSAATFLDPLQLLGEAMGIQDTGISELTFREYHELMGIYIYIVTKCHYYIFWLFWLLWLFCLECRWSIRMIKLWLGVRTGLTRLSKSVRLRCACLLGLSIALLSERAATFPGPIPAARHGSWKLNRGAKAREIPGESVPPMMSICLITTTCTHHFMKRHRLWHGSFL